MRFLFMFLGVWLCASIGQAQNSLWTEVKELNLREPRYINPDSYQLFQLDWERFKAYTTAALRVEPMQSLALPQPDGSFKTFSLQETSIFDSELSAKYPGFTSYTGYSKEAPGAILKLSVSPFGIHAMILEPDNNNSVFIDPVALNHSNQIYQVYYRKDYNPKPDVHYFCGVEEAHLDLSNDDTSNHQATTAALRSSGDCQLRSYRLALACTGEYASFHGGTKEHVLAAYNTTMTRVNGVYERDLGVTLVLIGNTDQIIYLNGSSDPYTNSNGDAMLTENQQNLDRVIGTENYDIGHVFSTGGGGIAYLNGPCNRSNKAKGVTGATRPVGDPFDIDYVSHEMGHQFGANHTQNNNCNRNGSTAVEPGSASTIMGYAGICSPDIQSNSDGYFHGISINEIHNYIVNGYGNTCATPIDVPNTKPTVSVEANEYIIPISTPFMLTAEGYDEEGIGSLSYCWEQTDNRTASMPPKATNANGPLFRSVAPQLNPTRFFPDLEKRYGQWEVLPSVERSMNFKCTVRDNHPGNGCTEDINVVVKTSTLSGPFEVLYPNTSLVSWPTGTTQTVVWVVTDTDKAPVNCQLVDIYLSTNGGVYFPHLIASGVPNTGSYDIVVPSLPTDKARIMVKGSDNIFFDISNQNFKITSSFTISSKVDNLEVCYENEVSVEINIKETGQVTQPIRLSVANLPDGLSYNFSKNDIIDFPATVLLTLSGVDQLNPGNLTILVEGKSGNEYLNTPVVIFKGLLDDEMELELPIHHDPSVNPSNTRFLWKSLEGITDYVLEVSHTQDFEEILFTRTTTRNSTNISLDESTIYFWRVKPNSSCTDLPYSTVYNFKTSGGVTGFPVILKNETLVVEQGGTGLITDKEINVYGDSPEFILFTISELPKEGQIFISDVPAERGDVFRMIDISDGIIEYRHLGGYTQTDTMFFNILDDVGRWAPEAYMPIKIKTDELGLAVIRTKQLACHGDKNAEVELIGYGGVAPYKYSADGLYFVESPVYRNLKAGSYTFYIRDADSTFQWTSVVINAPDSLTIAIKQEYYDLVVEATGGTGFLSYQLDTLPSSSIPVFKDPGNGFYKVTVQDVFGCSITDTITLDIEPLRLESEILADALCPGQNISVEVIGIGGFEPYTYSLNGQSFITTNSFITINPNPLISVKDAGGKIVVGDTIFTNNPVPIEATFEQVRFRVTVLATGGTGPLSYSKNGVNYSESNIIDFDDNGVYKIYVRDSVSCTQSYNIQLNVLKQVNVTQRNVTCNGKEDGYLKLVNSGGAAPIQYKLNDGDFSSVREWNSLKAGIYNYVVRDSKGDSLTGQIEILNPDTLNLSINTSRDTLEILVSGGTPPYRYSIDNGNVFLDNNLYFELEPDTYNIIVKDKNGCTISGVATITSTKNHQDPNIVIRPNPTMQSLIISGFSAINAKVEVFDMNGNRVEIPSPEVFEEILKLDVENLPSGMYILQLRNQENVARLKFIRI